MGDPPCLVSIVDDDAEFREALADLVASFGFQARAFASAEAFLGSAARAQTACLISDINMPGLSGTALAERLAAEGVRFPVILISAAAGPPVRRAAAACGALGLLEKPVDADALLALMRLGVGTAAGGGDCRLDWGFSPLPV